MVGFFKINGMKYEEIIEKYGTGIKQVAYSYVKDRHIAEDITQETFLRCFTKRKTFKGKSALHTWLYRIAINLSKDHLKTAYRTHVTVDDNLAHTENTQAPSAEQVAMNRFKEGNLTNYILDLPIDYREIIILYYFKEFNTREISEMLELPEGTVKSRLRRSKELLKDEVNEDER
ncbi:sigma-70 family RNA polymerase sigma factor [Ornithinibacillus halophilus]|uniref:RNA polymerase sigma-70 factor, ECF subfamily n=1 Tax=Ornithinibacillus halophilus TaxID=930117 RepID=A0A1M5IKF9_9BACI|nr:sigma-70 family RNA polymerase sigma factor [Ornithinibacillus halophilus]SHG28844.1 RNA polymerase sigma-70 factor, ECF subfamily [Ornithinibacillus halophilus]